MYIVEVGGVERTFTDTATLQGWLDSRLILPETPVWVEAEGRLVEAQHIAGIEISARTAPPIQDPEERREHIRPIPNYLFLSIFSLIFCCLPLGIVGVVYAAQVDGHLYRGDYTSATYSSDSAKIWSYWSIGVGLVMIGFYVIKALAT